MTDRALMIISRDEPTEVSLREDVFVNLYLGEALFNGAEAARMAGYAEGRARQTAYEILQKPRVRAQIEAYLGEVGFTRERLLVELASVALAPLGEWAQYRTKNGVVSATIEPGAKVDAIELAGRELGMFQKKVELDVAFTPKRIHGVSYDDV